MPMDCFASAFEPATEALGVATPGRWRDRRRLPRPPWVLTRSRCCSSTRRSCGSRCSRTPRTGSRARLRAPDLAIDDRKDQLLPLSAKRLFERRLSAAPTRSSVEGAEPGGSPRPGLSRRLSDARPRNEDLMSAGPDRDRRVGRASVDRQCGIRREAEPGTHPSSRMATPRPPRTRRRSAATRLRRCRPRTRPRREHARSPPPAAARTRRGGSRAGLDPWGYACDRPIDPVNDGAIRVVVEREHALAVRRGLRHARRRSHGPGWMDPSGQDRSHRSQTVVAPWPT